MWTPEYYVRYAQFPVKVEGVTLPNDDGTFSIFINSVFSPDKQRQILKHELEHIRHDHFYNDKVPVQELEDEANGMEISAPVPDLFENKDKLPVFFTLEALKNYYFAYISRK